MPTKTEKKKKIRREKWKIYSLCKKKILLTESKTSIEVQKRKLFDLSYYNSHREEIYQSRSKHYMSCKKDIRLKQNRYKSANKERIRSKKAEYNLANKEVIMLNKAEYNLINKEDIRAKQAEYNLTNKQQIRTKQTEYNLANKEEIRTKQTVYNLTNKQKIRTKQTEYNSANKEEIRTKQTEYNLKNKEEIRSRQASYDLENRSKIKAKQAVYDLKRKRYIRLKQITYDSTHLKERQYKQAIYSIDSKKGPKIAPERNNKKSLKNSRFANKKQPKKSQSQTQSNRRKSYARRTAILNGLRLKLELKNVVKRLIQDSDKNMSGNVVKQIELESLVQKFFRLRNGAINKFLKHSEIFHEDMSTIVPKLNALKAFEIEDFNFCISGSRSHTAYSECYFYETAYNVFEDNTFPLAIDENGVVWNMLTEGVYKFHDKKNVPIEWSCLRTCNIRIKTLQSIAQFFSQASRLEGSSLIEFFSHLNECHNTCINSSKSGHAVSCMDTYCNCNSIVRLLNEAKCHFSSLRSLTKQVYVLKGLAEAILISTKVLNSSNEETEFINAIRQLKKNLGHDQDNEDEDLNENFCVLKENIIFKNYAKQLIAVDNEINDFAETPCVCCERICKSSFLIHAGVDSVKPCFNNMAWLQLRAYVVVKYNQDIDDTLFICKYCRKKLNSNEIPCRSVINGLEVDDMPDELRSLNIFEQILIQKIKAFQTVVRLGPVSAKLPFSELIKGIKGRIVYLPLPLQENMNILPNPERLPDHDMHILMDGVPTKNKIIWQDIVGIQNVYAALSKLREINPLYKDVQLSFGDIENYVFGAEEVSKLAMIEKVNSNSKDNAIYQHYTIHPISSKNFTANLEHYRMKDLKGQSISVWEKNLDLLAFPHMFPKGRFGKMCDRQVPLSESEYRISRILNKDSRFRLNPQYLFHLFYDSEIKSLSNSINFMLRMMKNKNESVSQIISRIDSNDTDLETSLRSFFATLRGTKEYWSRRQTELQCMIKEFGSPVWFVTLSCAEYSWDNLYQHLKKVNCDIPNIDKMTPGELCALDPVSVVRHYHTRFHAILKHLILGKENPALGKISHYFWRVEYQSRSAPHVHMLLWSDEAPLIGESSELDIGNYIQKYVTCSIPHKNEDPQLFDIVTKFQTHKCSSYCLRKQKFGDRFLTQCKFGFPRREQVNFKMNELHSSIRHRHKRKSTKRIYELPRSFEETYINDYNPVLLFALKANVDVQYVGDESMAIARYVTSYISKQEKTEMDEVWKDICHESLRSRLWSLGLKSFSHRECGSYEIADRLLGTHLYGKSDSILFINTNYPEKRNRLLKPYSELLSMKEKDQNRSDIYQLNLLNDIYPNRPSSLENYSLYEFSKWYSPISNAYQRQSTNLVVLKNNKGFVIRKNKPFVINHYIHHPEKSTQDKENYAHQMLLMFLPWRCEDELLNNHSNYTEAFNYYITRLSDMKTYHLRTNKMKDMEENNKLEFEKDTPSSYIDNDPENALHASIESDNYVKDIIDAMQGNMDINLKKNLESLNEDQIRIFYKVTGAILHQKEHANFSCNCERDPDQILMFVSGVGGCGKSFLIQTIKKWMHENIDDENYTSTAVCAPTGLSALNVGGITIHRLLMLPVEHGSTSDYRALSTEAKRVLRLALKGLRLLIIDEVSMVSSLMLAYIHIRLSEITEVDHPFGKINVILFGDLLQLCPVKGNPPFMPLTREEIRLRLHSVGSVDLWSLFEYDELTKNQRQATDLLFSQLLAKVRTGNISKEDINLLKTRIVQYPESSCESLSDPICKAIHVCNKLIAKNIRPVCLFPTNDMCRKMNERVLENMGKKIFIIKSIDFLEGPPVWGQAKKDALEKLHNLAENLSMTAGIEAELKVALNSQVMLRRNIDLHRGLVNGAIGQIIDLKIENDAVCKICVQFHNVLGPVWIERVFVKFRLLKNIYVQRHQFPLSLAYGLTVHKSQGMSLDCAVIDIGKNTFAEGMIYVALSRVTKLEGLFLISFDENKIMSDSRAIEAYNVLRHRYRPDLGMLVVGRTNKFCFPNHTSNFESIPEKKTSHTEQCRTIKGFINPDLISCYANSALQILFQLPEFTSLLSGCDTTSPLIFALKNIIDSKKNADIALLSSLPVRNAIGGIFKDPEQQDVVEFCRELLLQIQNDNINLYDLFGHEIIYMKRCIQCFAESNIGQPQSLVDFFMLTFSANLLEKEKIAWMDLTSWQPSDIECPICQDGATETKPVILNCKKYLLLTINRFDNNHRKINRLVTNFCSKKVQIDNFHFETIAAISHQGTDIEQGHYTCFLKTSGSWTECNDTIVKEKKLFIRQLKDVYVLLLKKIE